MRRRAQPSTRRPSRAPRQRLTPDARRAQLLALGRAAFARLPYDDVSIDGIAVSAGISKGLLYHYFPTKRDLYVAGLRETADELVARVVAAAEGGTPIERLRAGLDAFFDHVAAEATPYVALMRGGVGSDPVTAEIINGTRDRLIALMLARLDAAQLTRGPSPLQRIALYGWFGMIEAASLQWCEHRDADRAEVRDFLINALQATLVAAAGSRR
jgi:AcrR family transcriptional regulator